MGGLVGDICTSVDNGQLTVRLSSRPPT